MQDLPIYCLSWDILPKNRGLIWKFENCDDGYTYIGKYWHKIKLDPIALLWAVSKWKVTKAKFYLSIFNFENVGETMGDVCKIWNKFSDNLQLIDSWTLLLWQQWCQSGLCLLYTTPFSNNWVRTFSISEPQYRSADHLLNT